MLDHYYLYLFDSTGPFPERVIISDQDPDDIHTEYGQWQERLEIVGDAHRFPCDRPLVGSY